MLFLSRYQPSHFLVACDIFSATNTSYHSCVVSYLGSCLVAFFQTLTHRQTLKVRICIWEGAQDIFFSETGSPHFIDYFLAPSFCLPIEEQTENVASRHNGILLSCWWKGRLFSFLGFCFANGSLHRESSREVTRCAPQTERRLSIYTLLGQILESWPA